MTTTSIDRLFSNLRREPLLERIVELPEAGSMHLVGGALRDRLLGRSAGDFDLVVAGRGDFVAARMAAKLDARLVDLGRGSFAAWRLVCSGTVIDLWDRRGMSLEEDLRRRDFTVNSMALDLRSGQLHDPFEGLMDARSRLLRATTAGAFAGDPLRVLRLPRLLAQMPELEVVPETVKLARQSSGQLTRVAIERVRDELRLLLEAPSAARGVGLLETTRVYPELIAQTGAATSSTSLTSSFLSFEQALDRLLGLGVADLWPFERVAAGWALLARGAASSREAAHGRLSACRQRGLLSKRESRLAHSLIDSRGLPAGTLKSARTYLLRSQALWTTMMALAAHKADPVEWATAAELLAEIAVRDGSFELPHLVDGEELMERFDLAPGREVGRLLELVREAQVEQEISTRAEALALVERSRGQ